MDLAAVAAGVEPGGGTLGLDLLGTLGGLDDAVLHVVVRQVFARLGIAAEGHLQNPHAGKAELIAQLIDLGRYDAEVLDNDARRYAEFGES